MSDRDDSERNLERLLEEVGGIAFEFDWNTTAYTYVSGGAETLLGFPLEHWYRPGFWVERLHPEDREWAVEFCAEATKGGKDHRFQYRLVHSDGSAIWVDDVVTVDAQKRLSGRLRGLMIDITHGRAASERLTSLQEGVRGLMERSGLLALEVDSGGAVRHVNRTLASILGVDPRALVGRNVWPIVAERIPSDTDHLFSLVSPEGALNYELPLLDAEGEPRTIQWHTVTLGDEGAHGTFSLGQDVTERAARERELERSRALMVQAEHVGGFGSYLFDIAAGTWTSSEELDRILGIGPEHPRETESWLALIHPDDRERMVDYFSHDVVEKRQPFDATHRIVRVADSAVRSVHTSGTLKLDDDGAPIEMIGAVRDVTPEMEALSALRESEEQFRLVVQESPFGMHFYRLLADGTLEFTDANPAADRLLGVDHTEFVGMRLEDAFPALADSEVVDAYRRITRAGGSWQTEHIAYEDERIAGAYAVTAFRTAPGRLAVAFQDVTETAEANRKERLYLQRLSTVAAELSVTEERERRRLAEELHDRVSQALAVARMKLQQVDQDLGGQTGELGAVRELLETAIAETRALTAELAPQILYELGLPAALRWLCEEYERTHGVRCEPSIAAEDSDVDEAGRAALFRAARELLMNAVKHAGVDEAMVSLEADDDTVSVVVRDSGRGFFLDRRAPVTSLGFGLFSIRERLTALGGGLDIESTPGEGTRVTATVPRHTGD